MKPKLALASQNGLLIRYSLVSIVGYYTSRLRNGKFEFLNGSQALYWEQLSEVQYSIQSDNATFEDVLVLSNNSGAVQKVRKV